MKPPDMRSCFASTGREPDSGARPNPAHAAHGAGLCRGLHPRHHGCTTPFAALDVVSGKAVGIKSSLRSCGLSTAKRRPVSTCIRFRTTMRPTTIPRSAPSWPSSPGSTSASPRPLPLGSTRWSVASPSSASASSSAARSTEPPVLSVSQL